MKAIVYLASGFEEAEAIIPIDMFRRAGIDVTLSSVDQEKRVTGSHGIQILADMDVSESNNENYDIVFLPGGMPGAVNLAQSWSVNERIIKMASEGKIVSAICASPAVVLANAGLLDGKKAPKDFIYSIRCDDLDNGLIDELEEIVKSSERRSKKWENAKKIIKWIADKGVDVGIALLPLLLQIK